MGKLRNLWYKSLTLPATGFKTLYKNRLRVLAYHDIKDAKLFKNQIQYLKENYNIISLELLEEHLLKKTKLPQNSVLITFDDGDISVLDKGLPIFKEFDIPVCLFIITELIDTDTDFWFSAVRKKEKLNEKNSEEIEKLMYRLKTLTNAERLKEIKKYNFPKQKQLTSSDLMNLKAGGVFVLNHSHTHPMFNKCSKKELREEFRMALKKFREFRLEAGYSFFAYPNGNWDKSSEDILKEMGIKMAFLFDHKVCNEKINPMRISRLRTNSDMPIEELKVKVSGLHSYLQKLKN